MALRAVVGKIRAPPAREASSRAFSKTCEHCGKTSSRIAGFLGQKDGSIKNDLSEELKRLKRNHYMIRALAAVATFGILGMSASCTVAYLDDDANFPSRK